MSIVLEALHMLHRLSLGDTLIAAAVGAGLCLAGPLIHEVGHLLPARLLCWSGRIALFPFRALGGFRAWIVVFAIEMPDEQLRRVSAGKAAAVLGGGPSADLLFYLLVPARVEMVPRVDRRRHRHRRRCACCCLALEPVSHSSFG